MTEIIQGSPEWLAMRCGFATASRFKDILAQTKSGGYSTSRRNYMAQLVVERLTGTVQPSYTNDAMKWGTEHEEEARQAYEERIGQLVHTVPFVKHPLIEWVGCSPDALVDVDSTFIPGAIDDGGDGIAKIGAAEIKCPHESAIHIERLTSGMEDSHLPQIQGLLWITGRSWCDFVSYDPRMPDPLKLYVQRVDRDEKMIHSLNFAVCSFLSEVQNKIDELHALAESRQSGKAMEEP